LKENFDTRRVEPLAFVDCWLKGIKEGGVGTGTASLSRKNRYSKNRSVCKNAVT